MLSFPVKSNLETAEFPFFREVPYGILPKLAQPIHVKGIPAQDQGGRRANGGCQLR